MAILEVDDIHTYYGDAYVLQGLSLTLEQGQILGLLGRNGVGKTTLVNSVVSLCEIMMSRRLWPNPSGAESAEMRTSGCWAA